MDSKPKHYLPFLFAATLIVGMFLGLKMSKDLPVGFSSKKQQLQLEQLIQLIDKRYVDSIDKIELLNGGIDGIVNKLDPHTVYISPEDLPRANEELEGYFYGIGMEFYQDNDTIYVNGIVENSPASKAHLFPGDRIIKVGTKTVSGSQLESDKISKLIRGQRNSKAVLEVIHPDNTFEKVTVTRDIIPYKSVTASLMLKPKVGYIKIIMFGETTLEEFNIALEQLRAQGLQYLIIDVRNNPGGYMDAATGILDELIEGNKPLLITKSRYSIDTIRAEKKGQFEDGTVCILINENSASASEILAGCIQDLDRGLVIGAPSYGKGLVQEQFELPNKAAIRITTARYYLPSGRCIQKSYKNGRTKYHLDHLKPDTSKNVASHGQFFTLKKRTVYDQSGIIPDKAIANEKASDLEVPRWITKMAHLYCYTNKRTLMQYKDASNFQETFVLPEGFLQQLNSKAQTNLSTQETYKRQLKTTIAKVLFGVNGEINSSFDQDETIKDALSQHGF